MENWARISREIEKTNPTWIMGFVEAEFSMPDETLKSIDLSPFSREDFYAFTERIVLKVMWITGVLYGLLDNEDVGDLEKLIIKNHGGSLEVLARAGLIRKDE